MNYIEQEYICNGYNSDCDCDRGNFEYDEDGSYSNSLHDKCKEICDIFQIPYEYSKIVYSTLFYDDILVQYYKKISNSKYILKTSFLVIVLKTQIEMIEEERNVKLKKIRFLILFEFMNLKKLRELITSNNNTNDVISCKIKEILMEQQDDQEFVTYIKNNLTFNI